MVKNFYSPVLSSAFYDCSVWLGTETKRGLIVEKVSTLREEDGFWKIIVYCHYQ